MITSKKDCPLLESYDVLPKSVQKRVDIRHMKASEWIDAHASGTLRKNKRIGMKWRDQYNTERIAYEFGWGFESLPSSRVNFGDAITAGDCSAITETGWHAERMMSCNVFDDLFSVKYIIAQGGSGKNANPDEIREGVGLVLKETSAPWIRANHLVFAIIALKDNETGEWEAENPC